MSELIVKGAVMTMLILGCIVENIVLDEVKIPVDGGEIGAFTYTPDNGGSGYPILVNFHGA